MASAHELFAKVFPKEWAAMMRLWRASWRISKPLTLSAVILGIVFLTIPVAIVSFGIGKYFGTTVVNPSIFLPAPALPSRKTSDSDDPAREKRVRYAHQWKTLSNEIYSELAATKRLPFSLPFNFKTLPEEEKNRVWHDATDKEIEYYQQRTDRLGRLFNARIQQALDEMDEVGVALPRSNTLPDPKHFRPTTDFDYEQIAQIMGAEALKMLDKFDEPH